MPFQPGQSGNPGGRPKGSNAVRLLAQEHTEVAISVLVRALDDPKLCVSAAQALLDRGWGRPAQGIELTGAEGGPVESKVVVEYIAAGGVPIPPRTIS